MKISILTLFPEMFSGPFSHSIIKRAQEKNAVDIEYINLRDFGMGKHKVVDDTPYGGGGGMLLRVDIVHKALKAAKMPEYAKEEERVILMGAAGATYTEQHARSYATYKHLIIICGRYEGIDARIKAFIDEEISIGNYVLTGGEIPAMVITDSVIRLLPGTITEGATENESFSLKTADGSFLLEYPQYTRPAEFNGLKVPHVLQNGNHKEIEKWREEQARKITKLVK